MEMLRCIVIFNALNSYFVVSEIKPVYTGPLYVPTIGEPWPKPQKQVKYDKLYSYDPQTFKVKIKKESCELLKNSIRRCLFNLRKLVKIVKKYSKADVDDGNLASPEPIKKLRVELNSECEDYPHLGMDEFYTLTVSSVSKLSSASIWGIIRGLETFSQLFFINADYSEVCVHKTEIHDYPRFSHRGILIDTSRHFLSVSTILLTIKALAINKMNVLHWHMTDDQSFPYRSDILPELSRQGAFHSSMTYKKSDILNIIKYARDRGVRVIPEFDVPSHTLSWGAAFPKILTACYNDNKEVLGLGTMNPMNRQVYKLIGDLFSEVQALFKDKYFHLGGDETNFMCWESNPILHRYMKEYDMKPPDLLALFFQNTFPLLKQNSSPIVWQDVFDENVPLNFDTIVQVWKGQGEVLMRPIQAGYHVLYSTGWYLDHPYTFDDIYMQDPRKMVMAFSNNVHDANHVIGGEACMWGETVDDNNIISKVWPRTCAVAERLWSAADTSDDYTDSQIAAEIKYRLEEHICRMMRRGIPLQPSEGPGFCVV